MWGAKAGTIQSKKEWLPERAGPDVTATVEGEDDGASM